MSETVSKCCHAEIKAYMPHCSSYLTSPPDPVPHCTECGQKDPEEVELVPGPCYFCRGEGWIIGHDCKKHTCPKCHGRGEEGEND